MGEKTIPAVAYFVNVRVPDPPHRGDEVMASKREVEKMHDDIRKKIRAEMKREILKLIDGRIALWRGHGTDGPLQSPHSHLTLTGELAVIRRRIEEME